MENAMEITTFGGFQIKYGNRVVTEQENRSKKLWTFVEYLIAHRNDEITHDDLIDVLWHDSGASVDPDNALKTILHRSRGVLSQLGYSDSKIIIHHKDVYSWNNFVRADIDFEKFAEICTKLETASLESEDKLKLCEKAFAIYRGDFLSNNANEDWVKPILSYYHSMYVNMVHTYIQLLLNAEQYKKIIEVCDKAGKIDEYDEDINYYLVRSLYLTGQQERALHEYERVIHVYYDQFGIDPSKKFTALYQDIVKEKRSPVNDLSVIKKSLTEQNARKKAYYCDFSIFQNLYRIEARSAARTGQSVYLCLITMYKVHKDDDNKYMTGAMEHMNDSIGSLLRAGDVYSRYSVNQYIIMLQAASYENCVSIAERIINGFENNKPYYEVNVQYDLSELEPAQFDAAAEEKPESDEDKE
ncbi:MAG TPA: hypothetical protein DEO62_05005 [Lachnospiraceae bacterium]|jgi:DNA-binding SARP family transcriptional activator|nr:hypothetical protein [Lachnospiraceae bacterium]HBR05032.1 hypothetical protein [Lachnospiraceae bacterium]HBZ90359.1 hypothetical protein [Lachnospiraceae bacterium]